VAEGKIGGSVGRMIGAPVGVGVGVGRGVAVGVGVAFLACPGGVLFSGAAAAFDGVADACGVEDEAPVVKATTPPVANGLLPLTSKSTVPSASRISMNEIRPRPARRSIGRSSNEGAYV
jgi:hypothetical protein